MTVSQVVRAVTRRDTALRGLLRMRSEFVARATRTDLILRSIA